MSAVDGSTIASAHAGVNARPAITADRPVDPMVPDRSDQSRAGSALMHEHPRAGVGAYVTGIAATVVIPVRVSVMCPA